MKNMLPHTFADQNEIVCVSRAAGLTLLVTNNTKKSAISEVLRKEPLQYLVEVVSDEDFREEKARQYHLQGNESLSSALTQEVDLETAMYEINKVHVVQFSKDNNEIINFVNAVFSAAVKNKAGDIAFEPNNKSLVVRIVVDGNHRKLVEAPINAASAITSRIKVQADLDVATKRTAQFGSMLLDLSGHQYMMRVGTMPTIFGERISIRVRAVDAALRTLDNIGLTNREKKQLTHLLEKPEGVILMTGPTGSGKTTTLYAAINKLNTPQISIMTVEDPVEEWIEGISQVSVTHGGTGMTFENSLMAVVRQNPDVLLVGEIRDAATAKAAFNFSLTGHLTLSTLHANSGVAVFSRLYEMDMEQFIIASSLQGVISQRLLRTLCPHCKVKVQTTEAEQKILGANVDHHYTAKGCSHCNDDGYIGRTAIYEFIMIDKTLRNMLKERVTETKIEAYALGKGESLFEKGVAKVFEGSTSIDELVKKVNLDEHYADL